MWKALNQLNLTSFIAAMLLLLLAAGGLERKAYGLAISDSYRGKKVGSSSTNGDIKESGRTRSVAT